MVLVVRLIGAGHTLSSVALLASRRTFWGARMRIDPCHFDPNLADQHFHHERTSKNGTKIATTFESTKGENVNLAKDIY